MPARRLANRPRRLVQVELRRHLGDRLSEPRALGARHHGAAIVGERGENDVVVVREHRDLVLRGVDVALEQQVLERALQARHLLREALAAVFLRLVLGPRNVVEQVDRAERRGEGDQDQRDGQFQRRGDANVHGIGIFASGCGASTCSMSRPPRNSSRFDHQCHQPSTGHHELGRAAAEHAEIFLAARDVQALLRLEELVAARLLPHPMRRGRVLRIGASCNRAPGTSL